MSSTTAPPPAETVTATAAAPKDTLVLKVEKTIEALQMKMKKLQDENVALRAKNSELKSTNSRVRRIPKAGKTPAPDAPVV
jgi:regulator of replication initiation timing